MASFVDRVVLHLTAGNGGHGVASIHREKFKPLGGPDGGNGGRGGDVVLTVDTNVHTLLDFHHHPHQKAGNGAQGAGSHRNGANGADLELRVPEGTVVLDEQGEVLADLTGAGASLVAARGGMGGLGNAALASTRRKAPGFALLGEPGEARDLVLELKSVADVGLVGFPSAGKSSLVAALSAARPKIADYPFTTLVPNLGVVSAADTTFTVADVPGLIPGAAAGKGLGLDFLRHVERCAVLLHVLDCATLDPGRDPLSDLDALESELGQYQGTFGELLAKPRLVALNKVDVPEARELAEMVRPELEARGLRVFEISAVSHHGLRELTFALAEAVEADRAARALPESPRIVLRPAAVDEVPASPSRRTPTTRAASSCAARSPSAGSGRRPSTTTRPSATSPTAWPASAWRRNWPSRAPSAAPRSPSATSPSTSNRPAAWTSRSGRRAAAAPTPGSTRTPASARPNASRRRSHGTPAAGTTRTRTRERGLRSEP